MIPRNLAITALITPLIFFETVVIDFLNPVFPDIGRHFGVGAQTVQYVVSLFLLGYALSQMVMGPLSDRFGRRRILIVSLSLVTACHFLGGIAPSIDALIFSRLLLGLFAGACLSVCLAIVRDIYGEERMSGVLSHVYSIAGVASILCGLLGGMAGELLGWRFNFYALAAYFAVLLALVTLYVPETQSASHSVDTFAQWGEKVMRLLREKRFVALCGASGLSYAGMLSLITLCAFVWNDVYGAGARQIGIYFAVVIASYSIGAQIAAHREKLGLDTPMAVRIGLILLLLSSIVALIWQSIAVPPIWGLNALLFVYVLCIGLIAPLLAATVIGPHPDIAGTAAGLLTCSGLLLCTACTMLAALFYDGTALSMLGIMAFNALIALLSYRAAQ